MFLLQKKKKKNKERKQKEKEKTIIENVISKKTLLEHVAVISFYMFISLDFCLVQLHISPSVFYLVYENRVGWT